MEDVDSFKLWLETMLMDSRKLNMTDMTIAYILMNTAVDYFYKAVASSLSPPTQKPC